MVEDLILLYAKDEIESFVAHLEFMQALCEANDLTYPYYVQVGVDE